MSAYRNTTHQMDPERIEYGYTYSHRPQSLTQVLGPWLGITREQEWNEAMFRASYYRWCAQRAFVDRDPLDGRVKKGWRVHEQAARVADLALCRYWLGIASRIREGR